MGLIEFGSEKVFVKNYPKMSEDDYSGKYPGFEVIARRVFGRSSPLLGDIFGIWISDFRVLDFEEGGAAELGGGAGIHGLQTGCESLQRLESAYNYGEVREKYLK